MKLSLRVGGQDVNVGRSIIGKKLKKKKKRDFNLVHLPHNKYRSSSTSGKYCGPAFEFLSKELHSHGMELHKSCVNQNCGISSIWISKSGNMLIYKSIEIVINKEIYV